MTRLGASRMSSVFGLKVRPRTATVLPITPPKARSIFSAIATLRASLTATTASTRRVGIARGLEQGQRVLGKAGAAEAGPGMQELAADAAIQADAARHVLDVGA